jgi:hypothetical protein
MKFATTVIWLAGRYRWTASVGHAPRQARTAVPMATNRGTPSGKDSLDRRMPSRPGERELDFTLDELT